MYMCVCVRVRERLHRRWEEGGTESKRERDKLHCYSTACTLPSVGLQCDFTVCPPLFVKKTAGTIQSQYS